jgi:hypothetical protein
MLQVLDIGDGNGWQVWGEWYGEWQVIYAPTRPGGRIETDPFMQVVLCNDYVNVEMV